VILQWSLDLAAEETRSLPTSARRDVLLPSMEPRPRGRGNNSVWWIAYYHRGVLQWSLDLAAEETCTSSCQAAGPKGSLQWSLDLAAEETGAGFSSAIDSVFFLQWSLDLAAEETIEERIIALATGLLQWSLDLAAEETRAQR